MGVCGIPQPLEDHAVRCVEMGMDMLECVKNVVSPVDAHPVKVRNHTIVYATIFLSLNSFKQRRQKYFPNITNMSCNRGQNVLGILVISKIIKLGENVDFASSNQFN